MSNSLSPLIPEIWKKELNRTYGRLWRVPIKGGLERINLPQVWWLVAADILALLVGLCAVAVIYLVL